jgi:hypothetical protein
MEEGFRAPDERSRSRLLDADTPDARIESDTE